VLGILNPIKRIADAARAVGAQTFVDGAQGAPHVTIDVQDLGCDFYAFSGHKLCGPMGAGALWARRDILDAMVPYHVGSNMAHGVEFDRTAEFEEGSLRFQAGTPDVAAAVGLAAAVRFLEGLGRTALWSHDQRLVKGRRPHGDQDTSGARRLVRTLQNPGLLVCAPGATDTVRRRSAGSSRHWRSWR